MKKGFAEKCRIKLIQYQEGQHDQREDNAYMRKKFLCHLRSPLFISDIQYVGRASSAVIRLVDHIPIKTISEDCRRPD
jgi:hypothetical protein